MLEIIYKSLIAAFITAIILLIAKFTGPRMAGAIGGIPIVFAISFVLITMQNKNPAQIGEFLWGGVIGAIAGIIFCLLLLFLNQKNISWYWANFVIAYVTCFGFAYYFSR